MFSFADEAWAPEEASLVGDPNPYALPHASLEPRPRPTARVNAKDLVGRRVSRRIVRFVWLCAAPMLFFGMLYAPRDGHPWQFPAAMLSSFSFLLAVMFTAVHWLLVVPLSVIFALRTGSSAED